MAPEIELSPGPGAWDHPPSTVCDGTCTPEANGRELWHDRVQVSTKLERHMDTLSGSAFRDDLIDADGRQIAGTVAWRLQVNDEIVEASLPEMERFFEDQLSRVRSAMADLNGCMPRQRGA